MNYTTTLFAILLSGTLSAQEAQKPSSTDLFDEPTKKSITKRQSKIIIRSTNGDEEDEIVIDDLDRNHEAVEELIEGGKLPKHVVDMLKNSKDWHNKTFLVDPKGEALDIEMDLLPSISSFHHNPFDSNNQRGFEKLWPQIEKGLKRAGIDAEAIKRARSYAEAYASPNKKHMIGVECRTIDGALRHQLGLEHGLVVKDVFEDTPAKEAGIENHDILLEADGVSLTDVSDLVELVQAAGVEDSKVSLVVLRQGKKQTISMKTKKREDSHHSGTFSEGTDAFIPDAPELPNFGTLKSLTEELQESVEEELEETFKAHRKSVEREL